MPSLRLDGPTRGLVIPSLRPVVPTPAALAGAGAWTPAPAAAVAAVTDLALAAVWCPIPGSIRPSAVAIFVVGGTAAVIVAPPTVHAVTAVAVAAPAAAPLTARRTSSAVHAYRKFRQSPDQQGVENDQNSLGC